mmetsp:Transcript_30812/g.89615  ORF Transcript_30812/g.89615 Transcript_30812/m.89615 type:complete len:224 (-) Transcript_30812:81-752(-)
MRETHGYLYMQDIRIIGWCKTGTAGIMSVHHEHKYTITKKMATTTVHSRTRGAPSTILQQWLYASMLSLHSPPFSSQQRRQQTTDTSLCRRVCQRMHSTVSDQDMLLPVLPSRRKIDACRPPQSFHPSMHHSNQLLRRKKGSLQYMYAQTHDSPAAIAAKTHGRSRSHPTYTQRKGSLSRSNSRERLEWYTHINTMMKQRNHALTHRTCNAISVSVGTALVLA